MKFKIMITVVLVSALWSLNLSSCGIVSENTQASKSEPILLPTEFQASLEITAESAIERDGIFRDDIIYHTVLEASGINDSGEVNIYSDEENLFHGEVLTEVHLMDYHTFAGYYIDYVGQENFNKWIEQSDVVNYDERGNPIFENGCSVPKCTIYEFIKYFGISREEFYDLWYYSRVYYLWDHDPDLLFSDDIELIDKYYRRTYDEQAQMMAAKKSELNFLDRLNYLYYDDPVYGEAFRKVYDLGYNRFSIPQLIYEANLPRTDLEECQKALISNYSDFYDYDFEMIYDQKEVITEAMKTKTPEEINNIVRSINGVPMSE